MRILQIAPPWFAVPPEGYGGIERVVAILADELVAAGHDVTLLASGGSRTDARLWTVFDTPPSRAIGSPEHEIAHWMRAYEARDEFDVIHDHSSIVGAALAAVADGPPVVHTMHGPWHPHVAAAYRALPPRVHVVALSRDHAGRAPRGVGVRVVHNGIDLTQFPFRETPDASGYLAFVGRANPDKGPEVAIRVAQRLGRPLRMALKINELNECRHFDEVLRPLLGHADVDLTLNGSAAQSATVLAGAVATLAPLAWDEPFGLVLAESMASGTPVVAFARGAAGELIADRRTGVLVAPGDVDAFCAAVEVALELSRDACRRRVEERFSAAAMVASYGRVYGQVTSRHHLPTLRAAASRVLSGVRG
jgi:glycosyltransferase involved in cell wall biosynthesis